MGFNKDRVVVRKKDWAYIKDKVDKGAELDYIEKQNRFQVFILDGNTKFFTNLFAPGHRFVIGESSTNDSDYQDFITNYKSIPDTTPPNNPEPVSLPDIALSSGKKLAIHESSRPVVDGKNFTTYWTGSGDDMVTPAIGGGDSLLVQTSIGTATETVEIQFHSDYGDVYIHEGYVQWEGAGWGDSIDVEMVATATPTQTSTNLDYELDGAKIKAAAGGAGTGTHGLNGNPVFVPNTAGTGYWDLVGGSPQYSATQEGAYDWYTVEVLLARFMNKIPVYGNSSNYIMLQSADSSLVAPGYLIRITANNVSDTAWKAWMIMTLYREQTG